MNREQIEKVRTLAQEVDALALEVLVDLDEDLKRELGGWRQAETPRDPSPSDHLMCGNKNTGALRRRSMDLTRALTELRKPR